MTEVLLIGCVGRNLLCYLDDLSLCQARLVCQKWRKFIDDSLHWWNRIIQGSQRRLNGDWKSIVEQLLAARTKAVDQRTLGGILQDYFATTSFQQSTRFQTLPTPYHVAVWNGNLSHVLFLWAYVKDKNPHLGTSDDTLMHVVAEKGHASIFKLIVHEVANKNPKGHFADTPLHLAAENGHSDIVINILARISRDRNPINIYRDTPLHKAAKQGHETVAKAIVNVLPKYENKNPVNIDGFTPMHLAARYGHTPVLDVLLTYNEDKNPANSNGDTPLHLAARYGHLSSVKLIIDNIQDKNPSNKKGDTPLHLAAKYGLNDIVQVILDEIEDTFEKNPANETNHSTPLHLAAEMGHTEVVCSIIHQIVFLHPKDVNGDTPFHLAANNGHTQVLASFLRRMKHKSPRPSLHNRTTNKANSADQCSIHRSINGANNQVNICNLDQETSDNLQKKRKCVIL